VPTGSQGLQFGAGAGAEQGEEAGVVGHVLGEVEGQVEKSLASAPADFHAVLALGALPPSGAGGQLLQVVGAERLRGRAADAVAQVGDAAGEEARGLLAVAGADDAVPLNRSGPAGKNRQLRPSSDAAATSPSRPGKLYRP
jgi:hypothetical protein